MFAEIRLRTGADLSGITILRNVSGLTFDSKYADVGAINFNLPMADAEALGVDVNSVVEILPDGNPALNLWFGIDSSQGTKTTDGASLLALSGKSLINWLTDGLVYPSTWHYAVTPSDYTVTTTGSRVQIVPRFYVVVSGTVTFTDSGDLVTTPSAHGLAVNDKVQFATIATTTGVVANKQYYVKTAPTSTTFTLSATAGGATVALTTNGTGTGLTKTVTSGDTSQTTINGHSFENATPGFILKTLVARCVERGGFDWLDTSTFTGTTSSDGAAWNTTLTATYANGTTLLQVIQDLSARQLIDFHMNGNSLEVFNYNTTTTFFTSDEITFRRGKQISEQTRTKDAAEAATAVLISGDALAIGEISDSALETAFGRRREKYVTQGGITDIPTLVTLMGGAELNISGHIKVEDTLGIIDNDILPWTNFQVGDWVWADFDGTLKNIQIQQISASQQDNNTLQFGVTLGDIIQSADIRNQKLLDNITGSGNGSYGGLPNQDTGRPPSDPTGVSATATAYRDANGLDMCQVTVNWVAPTTNIDGTALTNLDRYEVQYQTTSTTLWTDSANVPADNDIIAAFISAIPSGQPFKARVRAVNQQGHASNWVLSNAIASLPKYVTTPATPSTPTTAAAIGGIIVQWDGLTNGGVSYDAAWARTEVHVSLSSTFTPSNATLKGAITAKNGGVFPVTNLVYGSTYYAKLIAMDKSGNVSAASAVSAGATANQVSAVDIATNSITAAMIQNAVITGAKLATATVTGANIAPSTITTNNLTVAAFGASKVPNGSFEELTTNSVVDTAGAAGWKVLQYPGSTTTATAAVDTNGTTTSSGTNIMKLTLPAGNPHGGFVATSLPIPTARGDVWYCSLKIRGDSITAPTNVNVIAILGNTVAEASTFSHSANGLNLVMATVETDPTLMNGAAAGTTNLSSTASEFTYWEVACTIPDNALGSQYKYMTLAIGEPTGGSHVTHAINIDAVTLQPVGGSATITNLTASKITTGVLNADIVLGARIKTADTGARVEISSSGLQAYDGVREDPTVSISSLDGSVGMTGTLTASSISGTSIGDSNILNSIITASDLIIDNVGGGQILVYKPSGQTVTPFTTVGTTAWTAPTSVEHPAGTQFTVKVECWGGGGAGQNSGTGSTANFGAASGAGGEYARDDYVTVTAGETYDVIVGGGGLYVQGANPAAAGSLSSFTGDDKTVLAHGGSGAFGGFAVGGGTGSTNAVHFKGGANAFGNVGAGGGGGGSAGTSRSGNKGTRAHSTTSNPGGAAVPGGGAGGTGGAPNSAGTNGQTPGGGGGGAGGGSIRAGGSGARGQVYITHGGTVELVAAISGTPGTDQYGNFYPAGMWIKPVTVAATSVMTATTGQTIQSGAITKSGNVVSLNVTVTLPAITVNSTGNITNTVVATITDATLRPADVGPLSGGSTGFTCNGYIDSSGQLVLASVAPQDTSTGSPANITAGTSQSFVATYVVSGL